MLIDADRYLLEVLRYIHRNPQRAGLVGQLSDFAWSSHKGYISRSEKWNWLHRDLLLSMISAAKNQQKSRYLDFVSLEELESIECFYSRKNMSSILGSNEFKESIKEKFKHLQYQDEIPQSRELAPSPDRMITTVCEYFKVQREQMMVSKRGAENVPRDLAIYLVRLHCSDTLSNIGRYFGIANYSTVSSAVERIKARVKNDIVVQEHLQRIEAMLDKSQQQT